jgi:hypothetical protein
MGAVGLVNTVCASVVHSWSAYPQRPVGQTQPRCLCPCCGGAHAHHRDLPNRIIDQYRGAGESSGEPLLPAGKRHGCDAARCYGPAMIGWHSDLTTCARNVVVGIIDTGLDAKHPALKGLHLIQHSQNALRRGDNWHGTGVAALLAGARASSTPGLIPDAQYVVVDAFFASGTEETSAGSKPDEQAARRSLIPIICSGLSRRCSRSAPRSST